MAIVAMTEKFAVWAAMWHKHYDSAADRAIAFENFVKNDEVYTSHNAQMKSWTLGHNEFSDLSWEQFSNQRLGLARRPLDNVKYDYSLLNATYLAAELDWVQKGAVTPVKNQGQCGSCWTFSTTGAVEGAYQISTGTLLSFSEQELVSCSHHGGNGCKGGLPYLAFEWLETNALCLEADYPYTSGGGSNGYCRTSCAGKAKVGGLQHVPKADENALMAALNIGPVAIAIEADKSAFQGYHGGVLDNPACGQQLDHAVLLVAYGTQGKDYWKIKNSWGPSWGEGGYIRFVRGQNQCGLASDASYPTGVVAVGPTPTPPGPVPPGPVPPTPGCHGRCMWNSDCDFGESCWVKFWGGDGCCGVYPPSENVVV